MTILKNGTLKNGYLLSIWVVSAKKAFADSGLDIEKINPERFGVIYSSGVGGIGTMEREHARALERHMTVFLRSLYPC